MVAKGMGNATVDLSHETLHFYSYKCQKCTLFHADGPFVRLGHRVQNPLFWMARSAVEHKKQQN